MQILFIASSPQMPLGGDLDQLRGDANFVARSENRTFDNGFHVEVSSNLPQGFVCVLVLHSRSPRNNTEGTNLRQVGDELVGHAVGEIFLVWIAGEIHQRQDG